VLNNNFKKLEGYMKRAVSKQISIHSCWVLVVLILSIGLLTSCGENNSPAPNEPIDLFKPYLMLPTGSAPEAVAIGDVNGDGKNDVAMTTYSYFSPTNDYKLFVFIQNEAGELDPPIIYDTNGVGGQYPSSVAIGDINNNGLNEVVIGNNGLNIQIFSQDVSGTLYSSATYTTVNSFRIKIADLNNDGLFDIVGSGSPNNDSIDIIYQNMDGTLNNPTSLPVTHGGGADLVVGDVNNDMLTDIVLTNSGLAPGEIAILTQSAGGAFNAPAYYDFGNTFDGNVAVGDVTGDGKGDVVVTYGGNLGQFAVFAQNDTGSLDSPISYQTYDIPETVEISDLNADGLPDLVVLHGGFDTLGVFLQKSNGTLSDETLYPMPRASHYNPHGLAVGDINGDGSPDIAVASFDNTSGLVVLYHQ
jgi:hypothetical protein